jgi:hypothetical protein
LIELAPDVTVSEVRGKTEGSFRVDPRLDQQARAS